MTKSEVLKSIATNARRCPTCGDSPNSENFGGMCDPCDVARKQRLSNSVRILEAYGRTDTQEYRALKVLGY